MGIMIIAGRIRQNEQFECFGSGPAEIYQT